MEDFIKEAVRAFAIEGKFLDAKLHKNGHINSTYLSVWDTPSGKMNYIHQLINNQIFPDVDGLMKNISLVTDHLRKKIEAANSPEKTLEIVLTKEGKPYHLDSGGHYWRTYKFIKDSESFDQAHDLQHAYEAAKGFGQFAAHLADLNPKELTDTIPYFHDTPRRIQALRQAIADDTWNRVNSVKSEIDFVLNREEVAGILMKNIREKTLPLRVTHNDMKLNNLLFDRNTGRISGNLI